jgi:hypothetical protein
VEISEIVAAQADIGGNADFRAALKAHADQDLSTAELLC